MDRYVAGKGYVRNFSEKKWWLRAAWLESRRFSRSPLEEGLSC